MVLHRGEVYLFFLNDTATTESYTISRHDALRVEAGGEADKMPEKITGMDIRGLVRAMQTDASPWELLHFVGAESSIELAQELQAKSKAAA